MNEKEFIDYYWKQYILIEKEFSSTKRYLSLEEDNFNAYSSVFLKLLLEIGSEVDISAKLLCRLINPESKAETLKQCLDEIKAKYAEFVNVSIISGKIKVSPWSDNDTPTWWKVYNGVKHNRTKVERYGSIEKENYKFANQKNVFTALAGLYQLNVYIFRLTEHNNYLDSPLPGSRYFTLSGYGWDEKEFYYDMKPYINDDGHLIYILPSFQYNEI